MASEAKQISAVPGMTQQVSNLLRSPLQLVSLAIVGFLVFIAVRNITMGEYTAEQFVRQFVNGLGQGSIYALIALGYTLVYGILLMINFAHGEVFMSGAYFSFFTIYTLQQSGMLQQQTLLSLFLTLLTGILSSVIVAVLLERIAYRPLRSAPRLVPLITAIGASLAIQYLYARLFGSDPRTYPTVNFYVLPGIFQLECSVVEGVETCLGLDLISGLYPVNIFGIELRLRPIHLVVFVLALILMTALWLFIKRTKIGKAMRAVAEDKKTASLMGINVDRVIVTTFVLGAILAGAGAVLYALYYNRQVTPFMGFVPGIKAFTSAVLGGIGNIPGAMFGGLFLGIIESVAPSLLGMPSQLEDVIAFGMLVLVLVFRPTGIFGEVIAQKKA